jgi:ribosomal protein L7/L12
LSDEQCDACGGELMVTSPAGRSPRVLRCRRCGRERVFEVQYAPPPGSSQRGTRDVASMLPEEAIAALGAGNKIEAIKIVREATGLGLKEAKEAVERYVPGDAPYRAPKRPSTGGEAFPLEAVSALQNGRMIDAVKIVRAAHGVGLKEAKDAVDRYIASDSLLRGRFEAARAEVRKAVRLWAIALAMLAGLAVYYFFK